VRHSCADVTLVGKLLGFKPLVSFEEGLGRAIDYYQKMANDR
jgi:nucleoside-diphosphate-sugar epimerase